MPIQYAGIDLLLEDPGGKLCRWLDRFLSVEGMNLFGAPTALVGSRNNPRSEARQFTALPTPNYPPMPPPKVNSLYWPTGASRWGYGVFLADDTGLQQILDTLDGMGPGSSGSGSSGRGNPALLKIFDADVNPSSVSGLYMYMLPPRKVSAFDGGGANGVWLLPLVDQRYWWQFLQYDGTTGFWSDVFEAIRATANMEFLNWDLDSPNVAYGCAHPIEFAREGDSLAMMADAAAHCTGLRFVLDTEYYSGTHRQTVRLKKWENAETQLDTNLSACAAQGIIAGGEFSTNHISMLRPEEVSVIFPNPAKTAVGDTKTSAADGAVGGTSKTYHEAADTGTTDSIWRQNLADRLAADLKGWTKRLYDIVYAGVADWAPNGYDNYVEWFVGRRMRNGKFQMQTRACSMPYNFGVENLCNAQCGSLSSGSSSSSSPSSSPSSSSSRSSSSSGSSLGSSSSAATSSPASSGASSGTGCHTCFSGLCASDIAGYSAGQKQALTHDVGGCLRWIDIVSC